MPYSRTAVAYGWRQVIDARIRFRLATALAAVLALPGVVHAQLVIDGRVDKIRLCSEDDDIRVLHFELKLIVTNDADEPIILSKLQAAVSYYRVAADVEALRSAQYNHVFWMSSRTGTLSDTASPPPEDYRILQKGKSVEIPAAGRLLVLREQWRSGRQFLQIIGENLPFSNEESETLSKKWRKYGILWTKPFRSQPIEFEFPNNLQRGGCPP